MAKAKKRMQKSTHLSQEIGASINIVDMKWVVRGELERDRTPLGPRPERLSGGRELTRREIEQQLTDLIIELILPVKPYLLYAVLESDRPVFHQTLQNWFQHLHRLNTLRNEQRNNIILRYNLIFRSGKVWLLVGGVENSPFTVLRRTVKLCSEPVFIRDRRTSPLFKKFEIVLNKLYTSSESF